MAIGQMDDLGAAVRAERRRRQLSQAALAAQAGVSREWLSRLENGAPRLEADKVISVLRILDFSLLAQDEQPTQSDIAKAQKVAWTMALEAQALTDEGFQRVLRKIVAHRIGRSAA
ncbi:helix-turn-helix domain-containing protein [Kribbella pittospori]|uniref:Helix-turn-helix domain-containing protein n=1 Tax=Kribbella pittospori TaxID=722689 RepID=A0A4R0L097_9ACTN|nr:helix-turn-helix domain-containing protein [Kribbella pittospori]TCC65494.1 helix-turn-helix domain-containing protein [Kribbella pittospori]